MARIRTRRLTRRDGIIAVFVAVCLVLVMGMAAITLDGGGLLDKRRQAQATADAAAMAAACSLYKWYPTDQGTDDSGQSARLAALAVAATNGYVNDVNSTVEVNIPPVTGPYTGLDGYVEVVVTFYQPRFFSKIWGSNKIPVKARSVARGAWVPVGAGVIVLDYTGKSALNAQGNGAFTSIAGPVIVNSNHNSAVVDSGNGTLTAKEFFITGSATSNGGGSLTTVPIPDQVFEGVHPTPDPLAYLPAPSVPLDGTVTITNLDSGKKQYVLTPGRHANLPTFTSGDVVILKQASYDNRGGIYYIDGGGFKSTGATIKMDTATSGGVMIYNDPHDRSGDSGSSSGTSAEKIQITGNPDGEVRLAPLTSGPYAGICLWQRRDSAVDVLVEGNGKFTMTGTFYAASALMKVSGNGGTRLAEDGIWRSGSQMGSQYITKDLSISGNGNVYLGYRGNVSRSRVLTLVE